MKERLAQGCAAGFQLAGKAIFVELAARFERACNNQIAKSALHALACPLPRTRRWCRSCARHSEVVYKMFVLHATLMTEATPSGSASLKPAERGLSLLELALGAAVVVAHNVFHVVPNEVPI